MPTVCLIDQVSVDEVLENHINLSVSLFNICFQTMYYDHTFPFSSSSQILPTSKPIQLHTLSFSLSLENKEADKDEMFLKCTH